MAEENKSKFQQKIERTQSTFQEATGKARKRAEESADMARHKDVNVARSAEQFRRWDQLKAQGARFRGNTAADKELTRIQTAVGAFSDGHFAQLKDKAIKEEQVAVKSMEGTEKLARDAALGVEFAGGIIGEEGLTRMGDDAEVQAALGRFKDISETGLSSQEFVAERERMQQGIDQSTQSGLRGIQARLAKMGVKGATAGQQLIQRELAGASQKAGVERDLFLKSAGIKREGLKDYSERLGQVKSFDIGQESKEIDILSQAAFGFMSLGSSERTARDVAQIQKDASVQSAAAGKAGGGGTHLCTVMKDFGYLTEEVWEEDYKEGRDIRENDMASYIGYSIWASKLSNIARKNTLVRNMLKPFICSWALHIYNKRKGLNKINLIGKALEFFGKPICNFIGTIYLSLQTEPEMQKVLVKKSTGQKQ